MVAIRTRTRGLSRIVAPAAVVLPNPTSRAIATFPVPMATSAIALAMTAASLLTPGLARADAKPESGAGVAGGVMDTGDDRYRPAIGARFDYGRAAFRYFQHGYREGDVSQFGGVGSWSYRILPFGPKNILRANMGLAALWESTRIRAEGEAQKKETAFNGGIAFGAGLRLIDTVVVLELDWQHTLFPGGVEGIALALGRRQFIGLTLGVEP